MQRTPTRATAGAGDYANVEHGFGKIASAYFELNGHQNAGRRAGAGKARRAEDVFGNDFDLSNCASVWKNKQSIWGAISGNRMPPNDPWPQAWKDNVEKWMNGFRSGLPNNVSHGVYLCNDDARSLLSPWSALRPERGSPANLA
jgi:hypothetical protein